MKEVLRTGGLIVAAGALALVVFFVWSVAVILAAQYFKTEGPFEAYLFVDSFRAAILLVLVASWVLFAGLFLKRPGAIKWGRRTLYVYLLVCVVPYVLSFGVDTG